MHNANHAFRSAGSQLNRHVFTSSLIPSHLLHPLSLAGGVAAERVDSASGVMRNKGRITDNVADSLVAGLESPGTLVGIRESCITVGTTEDDDLVALLVNNLAAEGWVDHGADAELDGIVGA